MTPRYHFGRGECPVCHRTRALRADGRIPVHRAEKTRCDGSGQKPADTQPEETTR